MTKDPQIQNRQLLSTREEETILDVDSFEKKLRLS